MGPTALTSAITDHLDNRMLFREVNERIRAVNNAFGPPPETYEILCECGRRDCVQLLHVSSEVYDETLRDADRFVVAEGHERPALEQVIAVDGVSRVVLAWNAVPPLAGAPPVA